MPMSFDEYQAWTISTAIYPKEHAMEYTSLGLANEVGELLGIEKKALRDGFGPEEYLEKVTKESGDVLYYLARFLDERYISFSEVVEKNVEKLEGRKERGTLKGSGDER
jgi:NTP pyrophosphatase (non-canonical NTP hydrolase)